MPHALILAHMQNTRYLHGGAVYRESIRNLLTACQPGLVVDELFVHPQHHRLWRLCRQVGDLLTAPFSRFPAKVNHFRTRRYRDLVRMTLQETPYRLFVINGADMLWTLDLLPESSAILYISHNIEHLLYGQQVAKYAAIPGLGALVLADAEKFKRFEIDRVRRVGRIITIATDDQAILREIHPQARIVSIPPSFDYPPHPWTAPKDGDTLRLGFLGNLEWWPNRRSLKWFLNEVWPGVNGQVVLHLYGQGSEAMSDGQRVVGHGFVPSLAEVFAGVDVMIQPITCGGGVNIKVAEALYNRWPVIATPWALRGLTLADDPAIRVLTEAKEWTMYLNGPLPWEQARHRVREENAAPFSLANHIPVLRELLSEG